VVFFWRLSQVNYQGSVLFPVEDGCKLVISIICLGVTALHTEKCCWCCRAYSLPWVNQNLGCRVFPCVFKERNEQAVYLLYLNCTLL